jgi:hypothetical protein
VQLTHSTEPETSEARKKTRQWLSITKEILTDKDSASMDCARQHLLEEVLDKSMEVLEGLTNQKVIGGIREELSEALAPFLETMCMLPYQRWQYSLEMVRAFDEGDWTPFDPIEMEGKFGEKTGWVTASLFPQLCRIGWNDQDEVSGTEDHIAGGYLTLSRKCAAQSFARPES